MTVRQMRAIRGAITVAADDPEEIRDATQEILDDLMHANRLDRDDVVSVMFTVTDDLRSEFPTHGARLVGWRDVPMLCLQAAAVEGALPRCIRVILHVYTSRPRSRLKSVFLRDAVMLNPDLATD